MKLYGFLPLAAKRYPTDDNPHRLQFDLHKGVERVQEEVEALRDSGAPLLLHSPFGLVSRKPQSIESAVHAEQVTSWIAPWLRETLQPGDMVYLGSLASEGMIDLLKSLLVGDWQEMLSESVRLVLNTPGVDLCIDWGARAMEEYPEYTRLFRTAYEFIDELQRVSGARLYLEPMPRVDFPDMDHFPWAANDDLWDGAPPHKWNLNARGPGLVMFNAASEIDGDVDVMRRAYAAGHDIALNYTAFRKHDAEGWRQIIEGKIDG